MGWEYKNTLDNPRLRSQSCKVKIKDRYGNFDRYDRPFLFSIELNGPDRRRQMAREDDGSSARSQQPKHHYHVK